MEKACNSQEISKSKLLNQSMHVFIEFYDVMCIDGNWRPKRGITPYHIVAKVCTEFFQKYRFHPTLQV